MYLSIHTHMYVWLLVFLLPLISFISCDNRFFFCRIQEEEWDKYIIPAKSESEKYKVSRTFSFLMNRMTSPRNKSKVIKVLCLLSIKHEWLSFWAISIVCTFPLNSLTIYFIHTRLNISIFHVGYFPSHWKYRDHVILVEVSFWRYCIPWCAALLSW